MTPSEYAARRVFDARPVAAAVVAVEHEARRDDDVGARRAIVHGLPHTRDGDDVRFLSDEVSRVSSLQVGRSIVPTHSSTCPVAFQSTLDRPKPRAARLGHNSQKSQENRQRVAGRRSTAVAADRFMPAARSKNASTSAAVTSSSLRTLASARLATRVSVARLERVREREGEREGERERGREREREREIRF